MTPIRARFRHIWAVDFEFSAPAGGRPEPICMVAWELNGGQRLRIWKDELDAMTEAPYVQDTDSVVLAYYASAEVGCHLALGWAPPPNLIDLYAEFRNVTNGLPPQHGSGLLGALLHFGRSAIAAAEKADMRDLAIRGAPFTDAERVALLDYCESDVRGLSELLGSMEIELDIDRALLRGRYMSAAAAIEHNGIPLDVDTLERLRHYWGGIQNSLIAEVDAEYGVYDGRTFKKDKFAEWLVRHSIPWPRLESGALDLADNTFKDMAGAHPALTPLRELRVSLSQMRLSDLAVGLDGNNRTLLSAFRARTGRNQPSNTKSIFGPSAWLRGLIKPHEGFGLAYIDWSQQEFGIAAALSCDPAMRQAYESGDPYLEFAKQVGAAPPDATKESHSLVRDQFKACVLAVQYGMGADSLARRINQPVSRARELLRLHRQAYSMFWAWSDACLDYAMFHGELFTTFGWTVHVDAKPNPRSLRNFPMQANGAEMLRIACVLGVESGIRICLPVHDALLIEAPLEELDRTVAAMQALMGRASEIVLDGFRLRSDAVLVRHPDRYMDKRGESMWGRVQRLMDLADKADACVDRRTDATVVSHARAPGPSPLSLLR